MPTMPKMDSRFRGNDGVGRPREWRVAGADGSGGTEAPLPNPPPQGGSGSEFSAMPKMDSRPRFREDMLSRE